MRVENLIDLNTSGLQSPAYGGIGYWTATDADLARTTKRAHSGIASIEVTSTGILGAYLSGSGLVLPGWPGNYASTPDSATLSVTSDIDIQVKVALTDWTPSASMALVGKIATSSTRSFFFSVNTDGTLALVTSPNGTLGSEVSGTSSVATGFSDGTTNWVRATLDVVNSTNRIYKFYTSSDGITWTQLGTTQTVAGTTSIHDNNSSLEIGSLLSGTTQSLEGTVYRAIVRNGYDGAGATVFDADFEAQTAEASTFNANGGIKTDGLVLRGIVGQYASAPDFAAARPTGDMELIVDVSATDWTPSQAQVLALSGTNIGSGTNWYLYLETNGTLVFSRYGVGSRVFTSTIATGLTDGTDQFIKVTFDQDNGSSQSEVRFYLSADGVTFTQLGAAITNADVGAGASNTTGYRIGATNTGTFPFIGTIHRVIVKNGIAGTTVFDADFDAQVPETTSFVESSTNAATVTVNGTNPTVTINTTGNSATSYIYSGNSATIAELIEIDRTAPYRLFLWFHHETIGRNVRVGVQFYNAIQEEIVQTSAHYDDFEMSFREWTLASLVIPVDDIPLNAVYATAKIEFAVPDFTDKIDSKLWIDDVVFYHPEDVKEEPIVERLSRWIPEYMIEEDDRQVNPVNPMLVYMDVASATLGEVYQYISDFGYGTVGDPDYPLATSTLADPSGYPESGTQAEWLPWLAQLVGLRATSITDEASGGGTSWFFLESQNATWDLWESNINEDVTNYSTSWTSVTRTDGITTVNVTSHDFSVGDVFTISEDTPSATSALDGIYEVQTAPNSTSITFSQIYTILSLSQGATTTVTVTTGTAHNLSVGNTVEIDGTFTAFDGTTQTVVSVSQSVDSDVNDVFTFTTASAGTATVTIASPCVVTLTSHGFVAGDAIYFTTTGALPTGLTANTIYYVQNSETNTFNLNTTKSNAIANSSTGRIDTSGTQSGTHTITTSQTASSGTVFPTDLASGQTGTIATTVDLNWFSIEGENGAQRTPPEALAEFIRTGASGIWAGTIEGMKRAARLAVEGWDISATLERVDGYIKVTTTEQHELVATNFVEIYASPYAELNDTYTVHSVIDDYTFQVVCEGGYLLTRGWATNKRVEVEKQYWNGVIDTVSASSGVVTLTFQELLPVLSNYEITHDITITGTSNATLNSTFGTYTTGNVTISSDRRTITFSTVSKPSSVGTISTLTPVGANAKLYIGDNACYMIKTLQSQTAGAEAILTVANYAKPAGSALTHEYI